MNDHDTDEILDDEEQRGEGRVGSVIKTVVVSIVIAALALGVVYLLSERNARRYFLVAEGGQLLVQRGIFFPVGERRFQPDDPDYAAAYEPIRIPPGVDVEQRRSFDERTELDRVLVNQLLSWSRERIDPEQPDRLEQGIYYLRRAESLPTTTSSQRDEMGILRGEVAYHEGRRYIEAALRNLDTARERLTQARDSPAGWGRESRELLREIQEPEAALRRALGASAPEPEPPAPEAPDEPDVEPVDEDEAEIDVENDEADPSPAAEMGKRSRTEPRRERLAEPSSGEQPAARPVRVRRKADSDREELVPGAQERPASREMPVKRPQRRRPVPQAVEADEEIESLEAEETANDEPDVAPQVPIDQGDEAEAP